MEVRTRGRLSAGARLVVVLYVMALAALPLAHHDLLCHLRSSTHCDVCHIGTTGEDNSALPPLPPVYLLDAGKAVEFVLLSVPSAIVLPSSGRSPPAIVSL